MLIEQEQLIKAKEMLVEVKKDPSLNFKATMKLAWIISSTDLQQGICLIEEMLGQTLTTL